MAMNRDFTSCTICLMDARELGEDGHNLAGLVCGHLVCDQCYPMLTKNGRVKWIQCPTCGFCPDRWTNATALQLALDVSRREEAIADRTASRAAEDNLGADNLGEDNLGVVDVGGGGGADNLGEDKLVSV